MNRTATMTSMIFSSSLFLRRASYCVAIFCAPLLCAALPAFAQGEQLTLRDAVRIGLERNAGIRAAAIERRQAENSVSLGEAGYLPRVDATTGLTGSLTNSSQEFSSGEVQERNGAFSNGYSAGVEAEWTFFDGFGAGARYDLLETASELATVAEEGEREEVAAAIADAYVGIVRLQRLAEVDREAIRLSQLRRDLALARVETGAGIRFELTQAQVDLDADSALLLRRLYDLTEARVLLNRLLNRPPDVEFTAVDSIGIGVPLPSVEDVRTYALAENVEVRAALLQRELALAEKRLARSELFPTLSLGVGYNLAGSDAESGLVISNRSSGLRYGVNASINLFNGFRTKRRIENAEMEIERAELLREDAEAEVETAIALLFTQYREQRELAEFERARIAGARENLQLAEDRLELGAVTPLEVREAQTRFVEAESRLVESEYLLARIEIALLRASGRIDEVLE